MYAAKVVFTAKASSLKILRDRIKRGVEKAFNIPLDLEGQGLITPADGKYPIGCARAGGKSKTLCYGHNDPEKSVGTLTLMDCGDTKLWDIK